MAPEKLLTEGRGWFLGGHLDAAEDRLLAAAALAPDLLDAHLELARLYVRRGWLEIARHRYQRALRVFPGHGEALAGIDNIDRRERLDRRLRAHARERKASEQRMRIILPFACLLLGVLSGFLLSPVTLPSPDGSTAPGTDTLRTSTAVGVDRNPGDHDPALLQLDASLSLTLPASATNEPMTTTGSAPTDTGTNASPY